MRRKAQCCTCTTKIRPKYERDLALHCDSCKTRIAAKFVEACANLRWSDAKVHSWTNAPRDALMHACSEYERSFDCEQTGSFHTFRGRTNGRPWEVTLFRSAR